MNTFLKILIREMLHLSPLGLRRQFFPSFAYNMTARQLCGLCDCIEQTRNVPGCIAEVGCAMGATTVFLNKYMDASGIEKEYYAIDTFSGFTKGDIEYEVSKRGKCPKTCCTSQANKKKWFDSTMKMNDINRVKSIEADVNDFDFSILGRISFCLLDLDLYRPIRKSLPPLFDALSVGGILVVDDCIPNHRWDGADLAYREFCGEISHPENVALGKLGVIVKLS